MTANSNPAVGYTVVNLEPREAEPVTLDPGNPFDSILIDIKTMHDAKSVGYGSKTDPLQNFYDVGAQLSESPLFACEALLGKHQAALKQWFAGGKRRERTLFSNDAFLDRAVYAVIALELYRRGHN